MPQGIEPILSLGTAADPLSSHNPTPADDITISQTLLAPISLLSSYLTYLRSSLPQKTVVSLYRRIASRLSEHILQRQILYRGDFSAHEGAAILAECELWVETCHAALGRGFHGGRNRVEAPWSRMLQAARLVGADEELWRHLVDRTFGVDSDVEWEGFVTEVLGSAEFSRAEVGRILRCRRED